MIGDLFRRTFATLVVELIRLDAKVRSGTDPEALHDARVAVRRLRSYLRTFRPVLDPVWAATLRERLAWLNERLAGARDLDVLVEKLEQRAERAPPDEPSMPTGLIERLRAERDERHRNVQATLRDPRYLALLEEIVAAARQPQLNGHAHEAPRQGMRRLLSAVWKRARKPVREFGSDPTDDQLHAIRIKAKHVRYAAECFEALAGKRAKTLAHHTARLQNVLGDYRDAVMAAARLRELPGVPLELFPLPTRPRWRKVWQKMQTAYRRLS
ncbi:MAG: CHAD domain-containing protein [Candidatus Eremiobacteraeota bacterium]|nr:CHAD domain-containing protein [Candidatus Eremiobacteraeota bacterium]